MYAPTTQVNQLSPQNNAFSMACNNLNCILRKSWSTSSDKLSYKIYIENRLLRNHIANSDQAAVSHHTIHVTFRSSCLGRMVMESSLLVMTFPSSPFSSPSITSTMSPGNMATLAPPPPPPSCRPEPTVARKGEICSDHIYSLTRPLLPEFL